MENNCGKILFLDNVSFNAFIFLLRKSLPKNVVLLDKPKKSHWLYVYILKLLGYKIAEANFFAGHLKMDNGESIYLAASNYARSIATQVASEILETNNSLNEINTLFGNNTLHLHLTKQLVWYVKYWTERILVAKNLALHNQFLICLEKPDRINSEILERAFPDIHSVFYEIPWFAFRSNFKRCITLYFELFRYLIFPFNGINKRRTQIPRNVDKPGVLLIQEDTLRADTSLRGQPHWFEFEKNEKKFRTYIIKSTNDQPNLSKETKDQFEDNDIVLIDANEFKIAFKNLKNHHSLKDLRYYKRKLIIQSLFAVPFKKRYFGIRTALFLKQAEYMGVVSLWLNIKVFLFRESYIPLTDAIQFINKAIGVRTIAYQYSNLGMYSPIMMNTADLMLIFSRHYENVLRNNFFSPSQFLHTGYIYQKLSEVGRKRAYAIRNELQSRGVSFIICYFDESVQHDKWGLVDKSDHLHELHILSQALIDDDSIGIVIKSQFQKNTPSKLYPNDTLLSKAYATGRFIELHSGSIRNDIFPAEAGLISDIAIGHKFGATASLEVAIEGVRSIMIDQYGTYTIWDDYYDNPLITFPSIEAVMSAVDQLRKGNDEFEELGNWSSFLDLLTTNKDDSSAVCLRKIIEKECLAVE